MHPNICAFTTSSSTSGFAPDRSSAGRRWGARDTGEALDAVIADGPGWESLGDLVAKAAALTNTVVSDPLNQVLGGYSRFRRYTPRMLRTLDIDASPAAEPLLEAVGILCSDGTARPTGFLRPNSRWSRLLRTQPDHRLWETAVLFHLRDAFRAGDVWLPRSRRYGDIRKTLLSAPAVADAARSLPVPASPRDWLVERRFALDEGLRRLAALARAGAVGGGRSIEDSVLRVERTETAVAQGGQSLVLRLRRSRRAGRSSRRPIRARPGGAPAGRLRSPEEASDPAPVAPTGVRVA